MTNNKITHNTYKNYILGFFTSVILTIIPFILVINTFTIDKNILIIILTTCAILQIVIHLVCFLHIDNSPKTIWNTVTLIFTTLIILILIFGSIWIMKHLHHYVIHHN
ncbi:cytochrome o ubiquinol oxidase protein [Blochmannia endosymbiont of Polyrhachis (Hedomyrma) turneri]|nr:cytochrome o ubiquinol oxidase protein [Blochmannia endosymbiont of Polyrhachis (Hedomyrma) turneri]